MRHAGFTLVEMLMAILLTSLVFAITIPFFRVQTQAVDAAATRLDALQNARYAQSTIDRELRLAGGVPGQPVIVQAAPFAVTFNVDLVARSTSDPNATFYNASADSLSTESWDPALAKTLPLSTNLYPATQYSDPNGTWSGAETISYFLRVDLAAGRNDLYTLFRRVNDRDSTVVTRNLWIPVDTNYFFQYYRTDSTGAISLIAGVPLYWDDASRTIDSIQMVRMRIAGLYRDVAKALDVTRTVYQHTRLLNAGMLTVRTCGAEPGAPTNVLARLDSAGTASLVRIRVTWGQSPDETAGEKDVAAYVAERRPAAGGSWTALGGQAANGSTTYTYDDYAFASGQWTYGVVAQDCTPANSAVVSATNVSIP